MKRKLLKAICFALIIIINACEPNNVTPVEKTPREFSVLEKQIASSADEFSFKLFREIFKKEPDKNLFISPLSVSMALGMTMNGADGKTYEEMKAVLSLSTFTKQQTNEAYQSITGLLTTLDSKVTMNIANSIWYNNSFSFQTDFIETNRKYFNAAVTALNFGDPAAITTINNWVKAATNDKIEKIVEDISSQTVMFLINAIYFKGNWKYQFDKTKTYDDVFTTNDGKHVPVKMMRQESDFSSFSNELFTAVDLPYSSGAYSMVLFLPQNNKKLKDVADFLTKDNFDSIGHNFSLSKKNLFLPKFKLEYKIKLNDALTSLGMLEAFDPFKANFKKLYNGFQNAYISEVLHKTYIDVNEEGTEAAAVTSVEIRVTSIMNDEIKFNKPFLFLIREKTSGSILFIGTVNNPI